MARRHPTGVAGSWSTPGLYPADPLLREHLVGGHEVGTDADCSACAYQRPLIARTVETAAAIVAPLPCRDCGETPCVCGLVDELVERRLEEDHFDPGDDDYPGEGGEEW